MEAIAMDQTAIQTGPPPPKGDTSIQPGAPPVGANGTPQTPDFKARPQKHFVWQVLEMAADLRITVTLFVLSLLLVFWGTLAQVDNGVWTIVAKYFRSFYVWVPLKVVCFNSIESTLPILFPGGWLIGSVMLANLLAAHAVRFKLAWNRAGILLIHAGLIIIMLGELITGLYAVEGMVEIKEGGTVRHVVHPGQPELAVIERLSAKEDKVVTVPAPHLPTNAVIDDARLPFKLEVVQYMVNSQLVSAPQNKLATMGYGKMHIAKELPEVSGVSTEQRHDAPSAYVKLFDRTGKELGTWLFSYHFDAQRIEVGGKKYEVALRFKQRDRDFSLHLTKFTHEVFAGTDKPKDFHSYVILKDPKENIEREEEIYMNHPLHYKGETFYQSSWTTDPNTGKANGTILQVVRNPGWVLPYLSCLLVGVGMLVHFGAMLYKFVDKRAVR
jgi:hypothetical protein